MLSCGDVGPRLLASMRRIGAGSSLFGVLAFSFRMFGASKELEHLNGAGHGQEASGFGAAERARGSPRYPPYFEDYMDKGDH